MKVDEHADRNAACVYSIKAKGAAQICANTFPGHQTKLTNIQKKSLKRMRFRGSGVYLYNGTAVGCEALDQPQLFHRYFIKGLSVMENSNTPPCIIAL